MQGETKFMDRTVKKSITLQHKDTVGSKIIRALEIILVKKLIPNAIL